MFSIVLLLHVVFNHQQMLVYQTQGSNRQTIQVTQSNNLKQPMLVGSSEDTDNLQAAATYNALLTNDPGIQL